MARGRNIKIFRQFSFTVWDEQFMQTLASVRLDGSRFPAWPKEARPTTMIGYSPFVAKGFETAAGFAIQRIKEENGVLTLNKPPRLECLRYAAKMKAKMAAMGKEEAADVDRYHFAAIHPVKGILYQVDADGREIPRQANGVHLTQYETDGSEPLPEVDWHTADIKLI